jgi:hypothetical protein
MLKRRTDAILDVRGAVSMIKYRHNATLFVRNQPAVI